MAAKPRKALGFKYEVENQNGLFYVEGPSINGLCRCDNRADAEMLAAALNFATNYGTIQREAKKLAESLEYLSEFK